MTVCTMHIVEMCKRGKHMVVEKSKSFLTALLRYIKGFIFVETECANKKFSTFYVDKILFF